MQAGWEFVAGRSKRRLRAAKPEPTSYYKHTQEMRDNDFGGIPIPSQPPLSGSIPTEQEASWQALHRSYSPRNV
jgi:hypothetical protein